MILVYTASIDVTEDSYEKGESTTPEYSYAHKFKNQYETIEDLLSDVANDFPIFSEDKSNWLGLPESSGSYSTIQSDALVDVTYDYEKQPSTEDVKLWKQGRKKLYNAHISIPIQIGEIRHVTYEDFEEMGIEGY